MWIERLRLRHWRNFSDEVLHLQKGLNGLCGDNGAGKTNALEAVGYLSRGQSFRNAPTEELKQHQQEGFLLELAFHNEGVAQRFSLRHERGSLRVVFNGQVLRNWRGVLPTVLWLPSDGELIKGSPAFRRRFLDEHLVQSDPLYAHHFSRYLRILKQRNHLLRAKRYHELDPWSQLLARAGGYLCAKRRSLIQSLQDALMGFFRRLGKTEVLEIQYQPTLSSRQRITEPITEDCAEAMLVEALSLRRDEEKRWGTTLVGPHRDDFEVIWNGARARHFVSNGQAKLCAAGLRIAEWQQLKQQGHSPILLIDEFGSGLDAEHQAGIWRGFAPAEQIIAACTTLQRAHLSCIANVPIHCIRIEQGRCTTENSIVNP